MFVKGEADIMKFTRLNDNEIRCVLSEDELGDYGIDLDDIITKNARTGKFFAELLSEAVRTLGIENVDVIRMASAQITVLKDNTISIVFNKSRKKLSAEVRREILEMMEEQLRLGGNDSPEAMAELDLLKESLDKEEEEESSGVPEITSFISKFDDLEDAVRYARVCRSAERAESRLYVTEKRDAYYLLVIKGHLTEQTFRRVCLIAMEFGDLVRLDAAGKAYLEERYEILIAESAIEKLALIGEN